MNKQIGKNMFDGMELPEQTKQEVWGNLESIISNTTVEKRVHKNHHTPVIDEYGGFWYTEYHQIRRGCEGSLMSGAYRRVLQHSPVFFVAGIS